MKLTRQFSGLASTVAVMSYAFVTLASFLVLKERTSGFLFLLALIPIFYLPASNRVHLLLRSVDMRLLCLVLATCVGALLLQAVVQPDYTDNDGRSVRAFASSTMVANCLWMFAGMGMSPYLIRRSNVLTAILLAACLAVVIPNLGEAMLIAYSDLAESGLEGVNHLMVAEMLLLVSFFAYSVSGPVLRPLAMAVAAFLLFAGGGRSSFYFGLGIMGMLEMFGSGRTGKFTIAIGAVLVLGAAAYVGVDSGDSLVQHMLFSEGVGGDESYSERGQFLKDGLEMLPEQIAFGNPGLFARMHRTVGAYIHNILSVWQFFGLVPFLLLVALLLRLAFKVRRYVRNIDDPMTRFGILCFAYAFVGILFSKFVGFPFLWFAIGFWCVRASNSPQANAV